MRFLCFHGIGTNSETFKQQTAAIRYELGDSHTYDFVDGTLAWEMDQDMKQFMLPGEPTFSYCTPTKPDTCVNALHDLEEFLEIEGPYDGVIGFSLGANFALSWMINKIQKNANRGQLPFKVGIFFSTADRLLECKETPEKSVAPWNPVEIDGIIDIPTAHIWGTADSHRANSQLASLACDEDNRSIFVHDRGHEVPISAENVIAAAKTINRAIARAQGFN